MFIHQISVFVENRMGRLAEITGTLAKENIDIRALSIADTSDFGILRMIVNNPDKAEAALKTAGITVNKTEVIAVKLSDEPGALHFILELLFGAKIAVEYAYAFITRKDEDAYVILRVAKADNQKAIELLTANKKELLDPAALYSV